MSSLRDLVSRHSELSADDRTHLRRLIGSWNLLADLSFADLLLMVPVMRTSDDSPTRFVTVGQVRPATTQTLYRDDQVGRFFSYEDRPLLVEALDKGEVVRGESTRSDADRTERGVEEIVSVVAVPVRRNKEIIALLSYEARQPSEGERSELERAYLRVSNRVIDMIANGDFPFAFDEESELAPRVGDGVIIIDANTKVTYSSPNAVSALHRMGFHANAIGRDLDDLGFQHDALRTAFRLRVPVTDEIERGTSTNVMMRLLPLIQDGQITGAVVLLRDVSDLRRQERLLVSMDATIREIHHRVKNNLQTVSSLLRLQGRRLEAPEAKQAIEESVRRIRSIALVHEVLAQEGGDDVEFEDILRPIVSMVEEALVAPDRPIVFRVVGDGPIMPAATASSLAVVLTELLQNAVEHGYPPGSDGGHVTIEMETGPAGLTVRVHDDGAGLPADFDLNSSGGLGLTIARTLAAGDLGGTITLRPVASDGSVGAAAPTGAVAQIQVRFEDEP